MFGYVAKITTHGLPLFTNHPSSHPVSYGVHDTSVLMHFTSLPISPPLFPCLEQYSFDIVTAWIILRLGSPHSHLYP